MFRSPFHTVNWLVGLSSKLLLIIVKKKNSIACCFIYFLCTLWMWCVCVCVLQPVNRGQKITSQDLFSFYYVGPWD